jgi:hypothetical protein
VRFPLSKQLCFNRDLREFILAQSPCRGEAE